MIKLTVKRILAVLLVLATVVPLLLHVLAVDVSNIPNINSAMHFYIRHWHTITNDSTLSNSKDLNRYFAVLEGYIAPRDPDDASKGYRLFLLVEDDWVRIGDGDVDVTIYKDYIDSYDESTGTVKLAINPMGTEDIDPEWEKYAGVSISVGKDAIEKADESGITIKYNAGVHLVKAHVFYINLQPRGYVYGMALDNEAHSEQDTTWAYFYTEDFTVGAGGINFRYEYVDGKETITKDVEYDTEKKKHYEGDVVSGYSKNPIFLDGAGELVGDAETKAFNRGVIDALQDAGAHIAIAKVYNTLEGLHTNKTATALGDGRTFDLDLEAWFGGLNTVDIGLVLDASGSMAFTAEEPTVINIYDFYKDGSDELDTLEAKKLSGTGEMTSDDFLDEEELALLLNPKNTDSSLLGVSGYSYYVYDGRSSTIEYAPLAYWDGSAVGTLISGTKYYPISSNGKVIGVIDQTFYDNRDKSASLKGWYFINPDGSNWSTLYYGSDIQTAKVFRGLPHYTTRDYTDASTGRTYHPKNGGVTIKFYIDSQGNLRCFFNNGNNETQENYQNSYVYLNPDDAYTKVEALQRALGAFTTELSQISPDSRVSAVRFSTSGVTDLSTLVLQDWTNNPIVSAGMLSLNHANGGTQKSEAAADKSDGTQNGISSTLYLYNYGLTGSTSTQMGLSAFQQHLSTRSPINDGRKKYLIVFTDGRDTDIKYDPPTQMRDAKGNLMFDEDGDALWNVNITTNSAKTYADNLKKTTYGGYTIITVMLTGGPVEKGQSEYAVAKTFLETLSSDNPKKTGEKLFYSTAEVDVAAGQSKVDKLVSIFRDDIIELIKDDLKEYTVQDYIDPRFDIVDADGATWHLNANGKVEKVSTNGVKTNYILSKTQSVNINLVSADTAKADEIDAQTAKLYYNSDPDVNMYYLVWEKQTISGCVIGDKNLSQDDIWKGRVTVRAKDDFLGGNAVLSNGNAAGMNYVYYPSDNNKSSGTDDMFKTETAGTVSNYPSKGFPRTTVNVIPPTGTVSDEQSIYEGEGLSAAEIAKKILDNLDTLKNSTSETGRQAYYYWEYLYRYAQMQYKEGLAEAQEKGEEAAYKESHSYKSFFDELVANIIEAKEDGYSIPYYYLDDDYNANKTTQTGGNLHREDELGTLKYVWSAIYHAEGDKNEYFDYPSDGTTVDTVNRNSQLSVTYTPKTVEQREERTEDKPESDNETLVTETKRVPKTDDNGDIVRDYDNNIVYTDVPVYGWSSTYKPDAGKDAEPPADGKTSSSGTHTTDIISGEIVLQMKVDEKVIKALEENGYITYTVDLIRELPDGTTETVGTYTVTYTKPAGYTSGDVIVTATFKYADGYKYIAEYGLPQGTYTFGKASLDSSSPFIRFKGCTNVEINANNQSVFGGNGIDSKNKTNASGFKAPTEGNNTAHLGTKAGQGENYLEDLYAMFQIELDTVSGLIIEKKVPVPSNEKFEFAITLSGLPSNFDLGTLEITDKDGNPVTLNWSGTTAKFELGSGEQLVIVGLPVGTSYTITETEREDGYYLSGITKDGDDWKLTDPAEGTTADGESTIWTFTNTPKYTFPVTGGSGRTPYTFAGVSFLLIAPPLAYLLYRDRRRLSDKS